MRKITTLKQLEQLPDPIRIKARIVLSELERKLYSPTEIQTWTGLKRGERDVLRAIRKGMRAYSTVFHVRGWRSARYKDIANDSGYSTKQATRIIKGLVKLKVVEVMGPKDGMRITHPGSRHGFAIHKRPCCLPEKAQ